MAKGVKLSAKIALDVVMFIILVLLYKAKVLTLTYHEVAGIAILGVFLIHCLFNWRWIATNAKKLFSRETPARTKFSYWISIALVVSFLIIVISGVFISKVLFRDQIGALNMDTSIFRTLHLFFSALSLILVGIHLGLYWPMVKGFFRKKWNVPAAIAKPVCYVLLAAIVIFGAYSVPTSGFSEWLLCPVVPIEHHGHGDKGEKGTEQEASDQASDERGDREETHGDEAEGDGAESGERGDRAARGAGDGATDADADAASSEREGAERQKDGEAADDAAQTGERAGRESHDANGQDAEEQTERGSRDGDTAATDERSEKGERSGRNTEGEADEQATEGEHSDRADRNAEAQTDEQATEGERGDRSERAGRDQEGSENAAEGDERSEKGSRDADESANEGESHGDQEAEGNDHGDAGDGGEKKERSGNHGNNVELSNVLLTIAQFTSIMGLFAVITYYINEGLRRRKKSQA